MSTIVETAAKPRLIMSRAKAFNVALAVGVVVVLIVSGLTQPEFLSVDNLVATVRAAALIGIAAVGMTFITLTGNFVSLSTEQTAVITAILCAMALGAGWPMWAAVVVPLAVAMVIGALQGIFVALGLNSIITTLGAGAAIFGIANVITNSKTIQARVPDPMWLGTARPLGIPIQVWIFVVLVLITMVVLRKTSFGRTVKMIGSNSNTARSSGLRITRAIVSSFIIASVFAGICGVLLVAQVNQAKTLNFTGFNIDVVAAVLVGGTAIQGGEGSTLRTALGAIVIAMLTNYMLLAQYEYGTRLIITGFVVGGAVIAFNWVRGKSSS